MYVQKSSAHNDDDDDEKNRLRMRMMTAMSREKKANMKKHKENVDKCLYKSTLETCFIPR